MVVFEKYLVVFGGYNSHLRNCSYYNDTYLFNLETEQWEEMKWKTDNVDPSPRSACQLSLCRKNNSIVMYGGFSKDKEKEKGIVHTDMFSLKQYGLLNLK